MLQDNIATVGDLYTKTHIVSFGAGDQGSLISAFE